ncbi:MAG: RNA polymerase sigma-54 factor, partial [Paracoccaceae bacterium]
MNLSSSLSLRQKRSLAMTSQLRQAIALLQFNNSELHGFLAEKAKDNPFLEVRPPASASQSFAPGTPSEAARRDAVRSSQDSLGDNVAGPAPGLAEHVTEQIRISIPDTHQRHIAFAFLEAIEPYGWLGETVVTVAGEAGCSVPEAELVLALLQQFEPHGLFAR